MVAWTVEAKRKARLVDAAEVPGRDEAWWAAVYRQPAWKAPRPGRSVCLLVQGLPRTMRDGEGYGVEPGGWRRRGPGLVGEGTHGAHPQGRQHGPSRAVSTNHLP